MKTLEQIADELDNLRNVREELEEKEAILRRQELELLQKKEREKVANMSEETKQTILDLFFCHSDCWDNPPCEKDLPFSELCNRCRLKEYFKNGKDLGVTLRLRTEFESLDYRKQLEDDGYYD